ncbi:MAG: hypothetical protein GY838_01645 [bacterium]|nr:hypothetical protein [bacterium]
MTPQVPVRRLKMNARRRSPFMLLLGILTAGAPAYAASGNGSQRREKAAAADSLSDDSSLRRAGEVGWQVDPAWSGDEFEPWFRTKPEPRVRVLWQTGLQKTWVSGHLQSRPYHRDFGARQFTHDLGLLVRDKGGRHHWGGATTVIRQGGTRTLFAFKGIRRWSLDPPRTSTFRSPPG